MRQRQAGFTLMEMIGVVAVIAILASMATPMIFDAIRNARVTAFVEDVNVARTAVARYYEDTGQFPTHIPTDTRDGRRTLISNSASNPIGGWNGPYLETDISNPFDEGGYRAILTSGNANYQFDLDGDGTIDTTTVAVMRIDNVSDAQARKISDILDGDADTTTGNGAWYASGRVKKFGARQNDRRLLIFLSRE
ncbi:MAG: prepilin-type N-terminal cleavage/methylation domain-containing protein [Pseudomonadota bacterium]